MNPLIRNVGFTRKGFSVPPFVLYEGEMIRIWIPMARYPSQEIGGHEFSKELQKIFLGKQEIAEVQIYNSLPFADDICQSKISYFIAPLSVGQYLLKKRKLQIGLKIKSARLEKGMTQKELAEKSGTTKYYISRIENDKSDIELQTLKKIVEAGLGKELTLEIK